ncbi:hypothetical protein IAT38_007575 [Cryptococcus sp. DSM 104549]
MKLIVSKDCVETAPLPPGPNLTDGLGQALSYLGTDTGESSGGISKSTRPC